jgi:hypothetical protein
MTYVPKPGDIGFSIIKGGVGLFVSLGQTILHDSSEFTHVFVVLEDGMVGQAMPGGFEIVPLSNYTDRNERLAFAHPDLTEEQRLAITSEAKKVVGVGYSFLTYGYLALRRLGFKCGWLKKRVANRGELICSQAVDLIYQRAGVQLFDDGRGNLEVTPGDLFRLSYENGWLKYVSKSVYNGD